MSSKIFGVLAAFWIMIPVAFYALMYAFDFELILPLPALDKPASFILPVLLYGPPVACAVLWIVKNKNA